MNNITNVFTQIYQPVKALVVYQTGEKEKSVYVESYDMDHQGGLINAHPLSIEEAADLADTLQVSTEMKKSFLIPCGLLPENVLYINPDQLGLAVWYTPPQSVPLFFTKGLDIPCGQAAVPALLWKANQESLYIYALPNAVKPTIHFPLYYAPFFNIHEDGQVCMGTVDTDIADNCSLEAFIDQWQAYFFNSYFSHLLGKQSPVKGNIVQLWQQQVKTGKAFPKTILKKTSKTIKDILG